MRRERRERNRINEGIEEEDWREYFTDLLGGTEGGMWEKGRGRRRGTGK